MTYRELTRNERKGLNRIPTPKLEKTKVSPPTVKHRTSCDSYGDAEELHVFIQKHCTPYIDSKIDEGNKWEVWIWCNYDSSIQTMKKEDE